VGATCGAWCCQLYPSGWLQLLRKANGRRMKWSVANHHQFRRANLEAFWGVLLSNFEQLVTQSNSNLQSDLQLIFSPTSSTPAFIDQ
jgi:hypothetical protein